MPGTRQIYEDKVVQGYFETSQRWRSDTSPAALEKSAARYEAQLGEHLPDDPGAPILDIGCGSGAFLSFCARRGFRNVIGLDVAEDQINFCHDRGLDNAIRGDGLDFLRESRDSFSLIVLLDVIEHLPKERGFALAACARKRLRRGGRLIVRTPNMSNPLNLQARYGDFQHDLGFTKESLEQYFRAAGLEVETVYSPDRDHRNPLLRFVFDVILWRAFKVIYRRTFRLKREVIRGKNLIGVARRGTIDA